MSYTQQVEGSTPSLLITAARMSVVLSILNYFLICVISKFTKQSLLYKREGFFFKEVRIYRKRYYDRESWLKARLDGIGASDSSVVMGLSPWTTVDELWDLKTRRTEQKDISNNPAVKYGVDAEPLIRDFVALDFPFLKVDYHGMDILHHDLYPFITATLDGELTDTRFKNRKGVLEIKTGSYRNREDLEKWENGDIPIYYYTQVCQQLAVTGWQFAIVAAKLTKRPYTNEEIDFDLPESVWKYAYFSANDKNVKASIQEVLRADIEFWNYVESGVRPPSILRFNK